MKKPPDGGGFVWCEFARGKRIGDDQRGRQSRVRTIKRLYKISGKIAKEILPE